jgi:aconitase A
MVFFIHFDKADLRAAMKGFARIHWQNLCNFGILPLTFADFNLPAKV